MAPFDQELTVLVISFDSLTIRSFSTVGVCGVWFFNACYGSAVCFYGFFFQFVFIDLLVPMV